MAELGWVGIPIPEEHGGAGMGLADLAIVLEALGRNLAPEPFVSTVLLGARLLTRAGSQAQQKAWLPSIASGEKILTLAYQETQSRYDHCSVETQAEAAGAGFRLRGEKVQVLDGHVADGFLVSARTGGNSGAAEGLSIFLVPADASGITCTRQTRVDHRNAALVNFDGVEVGPEAVVGEVDRAEPLLADVIDYATAGLCAEMLGGMQQAFDMTLDHVKERKQFETVVGSFQALKTSCRRCLHRTRVGQECDHGGDSSHRRRSGKRRLARLPGEGALF